ncbi:MAG: cysteine-rich CWC family protein [Elusimicrobia bacterium]|nr:cysteine-rich CWC family protein [Elusimicrobiota bacterium]
MPQQKSCQRCRASFGCGANDAEATCWCAELPPVMPLDDAGCLCPPCLKGEIAALIKAAGLCAGCRHAQRLRSKGGGLLHLCGLSKTDARYKKYPRLPMSECPGYEPITAARP